MIKRKPKWLIFEIDGRYWVCQKQFGAMAPGKTIDEAKRNWFKLMAEYEAVYGQKEDD